MSDLPATVAEVAAKLAALPGAVAVVLGGSRAIGAHRPDSDWDLGLYYRSGGAGLDPADVRGLGYRGRVSELGEWGPLVNGGGWLEVPGRSVDVLYRDLDAVERHAADARRGRFDVLLQPGTIVGSPTYLPVGELASCRLLHGELEQPAAYPEQLARSAPGVWRGKAGVNLMFARGYAGLADVVSCLGMLSQAVLCEAHARLAEQRRWALNEKRLVVEAGLVHVHALLAGAGTTTAGLTATVAAVERGIGLAPADKR